MDYGLFLMKNPVAISNITLRASVYAFQNKEFKVDDDSKNKIALDTTIKSYKGIDKRAGLVSIGEIIVGSRLPCLFRLKAC